MSTNSQQLAKDAFDRALQRFGQWDPAIVLGMLAGELSDVCGFSGTLRTSDDLLALQDVEADHVPDLLPSILEDLPEI